MENILDLKKQEQQEKTSATVKEKEPSTKGFLFTIFEFFAWLVVIIVAANLIHKFIFHPFYVIGPSMLPSFQNGNYLFVEKLGYRFGEPQRGDVVVFTPPWDSQNQKVEEERERLGFIPFQIKRWQAKFSPFFGTPMRNLEIKQYIKRILALPGETVVFNDETITIKNETSPQGFVLQEPYIQHHSTGSLKMTLGADEYFVSGDNRPNSSDSRGTKSGRGLYTNPHAVPRDTLEGKVFIRLWPPSEVGVMQSPDYSTPLASK